MRTRTTCLQLGLALALGCTPGSTRRECDAQAFEGALTQFEIDPGGEGAPLELIHAIANACPDYPSALRAELGDADERDVGDPLAYSFAREMACEDPLRLKPDDWDDAARGPAIYEACGFERLGLLEPNEPFLLEDLPAMVSHDWMLDHRVDPDLALVTAPSLWGRPRYPPGDRLTVLVVDDDGVQPGRGGPIGHNELDRLQAVVHTLLADPYRWLAPSKSRLGSSRRSSRSARACSHPRTRACSCPSA